MLELFMESLFYSRDDIIAWMAAAIASAAVAILLFRKYRPKLIAFLLPLIWMIGYGGYNTILYGNDGQFGLFLLDLVPKSIAASALAPILVTLAQRLGISAR
ncbi:UNVERIFIED_ORG: hypothetical protein LHK14_25300 (plasmid) [Roseateles sp. XES5]|nr:hypothetical protein [Roseateles sp. XES5]